MAMEFQSAAVEDTVIGKVMTKFVAGDPTMFDMIAQHIDFRIDHFQDDADTSWQHANTRDDLMAVVRRLGADVFPKGTKMLGIKSAALGDGWHLTSFSQQFFYGVKQKDVESLTYILSHETDGLLDYFRETVTHMTDVS